MAKIVSGVQTDTCPIDFTVLGTTIDRLAVIITDARPQLTAVVETAQAMGRAGLAKDAPGVVRQIDGIIEAVEPLIPRVQGILPACSVPAPTTPSTPAVPSVSPYPGVVYPSAPYPGVVPIAVPETATIPVPTVDAATAAKQLNNFARTLKALSSISLIKDQETKDVLAKTAKFVGIIGSTTGIAIQTFCFNISINSFLMYSALCKIFIFQNYMSDYGADQFSLSLSAIP
jgi:hypothetical protein